MDLVAFNLDNLYERFDQARTKANQGKIYMSKRDFLYSKINRVMLTIIEDTYRGTHDLQYGMCSKYARDEQWKRRENPEMKAWFNERGIFRREDLPDHGCYENIFSALQNYPVLPVDIPSPINLFQSVEIGPKGVMMDCRNRDRPEPGKPALVALRAEMNCLIAMSACPEMDNSGKAIRVQVCRE